MADKNSLDPAAYLNASFVSQNQLDSDRAALERGDYDQVKHKVRSVAPQEENATELWKKLKEAKDTKAEEAESRAAQAFAVAKLGEEDLEFYKDVEKKRSAVNNFREEAEAEYERAVKESRAGMAKQSDIDPTLIMGKKAQRKKTPPPVASVVIVTKDDPEKKKDKKDKKKKKKRKRDADKDQGGGSSSKQVKPTPSTGGLAGMVAYGSSSDEE
eukprot:GFYU01011924.1.p1 GENE.GFYU01011924.1~~GFYU01011924.1.p1  ORF type:complete len:214 (+),score=78.84 GFYU01011924.1:75-716(+)